MRYSPAPLVLVVVLTLVPVLVAVTVALGTPEPLGSAIVPTRSPLMAWAARLTEKTNPIAASVRLNRANRRAEWARRPGVARFVLCDMPRASRRSRGISLGLRQKTEKASCNPFNTYGIYGNRKRHHTQEKIENTE